MILALAFSLACSSHPEYTLRPVVSAVSVRRDGPDYRASAALRFTVFPAIRPPATSDAGFNDHVRGHQIIAQRVAGSSNGSVQANGKTPGDARRQLARALDRLRSDAQKELDREQRVYDSVTQDGLEQNQGPAFGFPGGRNARARCVH